MPEHPDRSARTAVVTGGAGFIGRHLCERLLELGYRVVCIDDFSSSDTAPLASLMTRPGFSLIKLDVRQPVEVPGAVEAIFHLASPASPVDFQRAPLATLQTGAIGTLNVLALARRTSARFLLASSSEVYGDPAIDPQPESYRGNVNPTGPRSMYDEAKRFAEAAATAAACEHGIEVRIARIFNTAGPGMRPDDGRLLPTLAIRALSGLPLTIHGDGSQTRSLTYVADTVEGLVALMGSEQPGPVNIGNPDERTVLDIARMVAEAAGHGAGYVFVARPGEDPSVRCPDITVARAALGWEPVVQVEDIVERTVEWFRSSAVLERAG